MKSSDYDAWVLIWNTDVYYKAKEIDPSNEQDWYSMSLGFFIGKGLSIKDAHELSTYIRYHTKWG